MFSVVSTEEITEENYVYGKEYTVEVRSMSEDDIFSLVNCYQEIIGDCEVTRISGVRTAITDAFPSLLSSSRYKNGMAYSITMTAVAWVSLLAALGAGITYENFEDELKTLLDEGEKRVSPLLIFVKSIYTMAVQVYAPFSFADDKKGEVIH
jgi:hypothetical protein